MAGRSSRFLVVALVAALIGLSTAASVGAAPPRQTQAKPIATLKVDTKVVTVRKAGKVKFKTAKHNQKLHEGDTVLTGPTGLAEIDYSDDSYTRLDVDTEFTIEQLTDDEGNRRVEGILESGRTWNRTIALTESQSFEQSGAGATAAVVGTVFFVECLTRIDCRFVGIEHTIRLFNDNGQLRVVPALDECASTDGNLCNEPRHLTVEEIAGIQWVQDNLTRDLEERGLGSGPFVISPPDVTYPQPPLPLS